MFEQKELVMKQILTQFCFLSIFILLLATSAARAEHSMNIKEVSISGSSVYITARATGVGATGIEMEGRVCLSDNSVAVRGSTHTFSQADLRHRFTVNNVPESILTTDFLVAVTESTSGTDCNNGAEGYSQLLSYVRATNPATPVPVMPLGALWILGGLAGLLGVRQLRKAAQ